MSCFAEERGSDTLYSTEQTSKSDSLFFNGVAEGTQKLGGITRESLVSS
jgi:hypothetical protein